MRSIRFVPVALGLMLAAWVLPVHAFDVPANDGYYTQTTPVLTSAQEADIESILTDEEKTTSNEFAVLVVESLNDEPIEDAANLVYRTWGIGKKDKDNGVLLLVVTADHRMRIEVGYGLEGAIPDIVAKGVIDEDIAPQFKEAKYYEGILAGIDALKKHAAGEYTADRYATDGGGSPIPFFFFILFIVVNFLGAWFSRTKSWWLGGVMGGVFGVILAIAFSWWLAIPLLVVAGLGFDFFASKFPNAFKRSGRRGFWGGGGFGGGSSGSGGGGFGGFGGGSSGGGGASGGW